MPDFMAHDRRQFIHPIHGLNETGIEKNMPAGTGKCVEGFVVDNIKLKRKRLCFKGCQKIVAQSIEVFADKRVRDQFTLTTDLKEKGLAHFPFVFYGKGMGF